VRLALLASTALIALSAACGDRAERVVLGASGPFTQPNGASNRRGIELAVEEINARDAWKSRPLEVVFADDSARGAVAARVAQQFVDDPTISAVVGHVNSRAMAAAARVYDGHLPAIATSATSPELTGISPWAFRVSTSDAANGRTIAQFANARGFRRAGVLYESTSYGRGLASAFQSAFQGEIIAFDPVDETAQDSMEPFVSFFRARNPDVVFVASTHPGARAFITEARRQGLQTQILGGDGWMPLLADSSLANGVYLGAPFAASDPRPEARTFVEAYRRKFGNEPDGYAALGYDATMLLATVIERVGTDRQRVRDALAALDRPYPGVTGPIHFAATGDPEQKSIVMAQIRNCALIVDGAR
jgi:branched-chain amino acid transport system substrate-binding protein